MARPQPRGGKGAAMRGGCCMCMGEALRSCELAKFAKITYHAQELRQVVRKVRGRSVVPSHSRGGGGGWAEPVEKIWPPLGAAAASAMAQEQSRRSSALPGPVSMTTISVLESTYRSEPTWRLWSGPSSASLHFFFFFFFFCGSGRRLCRRNQEKPERGGGLPAPLRGRSTEWRPIIWFRLFTRTLPTVTRRNLV